jgi:hypothetical protein
MNLPEIPAQCEIDFMSVMVGFVAGILFGVSFSIAIGIISPGVCNV